MSALTTCAAKRVYRSRQEAQDAAWTIEAIEGVSMFPYRCALCEHYHLTRRSRGSNGQRYE